MGLVKHHQMEIDERGWDAPETFVCDSCIEDAYLKQAVIENAEDVHCDYCDRIEEEAIAAPLSVVVEPIANTLFAYFAEPGSASLPRDSGEWIDEEKITYTEDALESIGLGCEEALFRDIAQSFQNDAWYPCAHGFWLGQHEHEELQSAWHSFEYDIKHQRRYFFNLPQHEADAIVPEKYLPFEILEKIGALIQEMGMIKILAIGQILYRVRRTPAEGKFTSFEDLGPPPDEIASAGRMNPPGISYFYLALEQDTALLEVLDTAPYRATIATFKVSAELLLLDLTKVPDYPSIFDETRRDEREGLIFLDHFIEAIASPISKDGREHIEYVPSQVVSEYFSQVFRTDDGKRLDGIMYPSTTCPGGNNVVIFPRFDVTNRWQQIMNLVNIETRNFNRRDEFETARLVDGFSD